MAQTIKTRLARSEDTRRGTTPTRGQQPKARAYRQSGRLVPEMAQREKVSFAVLTLLEVAKEAPEFISREFHHQPTPPPASPLSSPPAPGQCRHVLLQHGPSLADGGLRGFEIGVVPAYEMSE